MTVLLLDSGARSPCGASLIPRIAVEAVAPEAPAVLHSCHRLPLQMNLHGNLWHRAGAMHPSGTLYFTGNRSDNYKQIIKSKKYY